MTFSTFGKDVAYRKRTGNEIDSNKKTRSTPEQLFPAHSARRAFN